MTTPNPSPTPQQLAATLQNQLAAATATANQLATALTPTTPPPTPTPAPTTTTWKSGIYLGASEPASATAAREASFETWRALQCPFVTTYVSQGTWAQQLSPWWQGFRLRPTQALNVAIPLWPQNGGTPSTTYGTQWTQFAQLLQPGDIIRLSWECNLTSWYWMPTAANWTAWQAAWKSAYTAIKAAQPKVSVCLCLNASPSQSPISNTQFVTALAGYFDLIGTDFYWCYLSNGDTPASWNNKINQDGGLGWTLAQAQKYNAKIDVGEWGNCSVAAAGVGDSPFFINQMQAWFAANAAWLNSEAYFSQPGQTTYLPIYPTSSTPTPNAAAAYRAGIQQYLIPTT